MIECYSKDGGKDRERVPKEGIMGEKGAISPRLAGSATPRCIVTMEVRGEEMAIFSLLNT